MSNIIPAGGGAMPKVHSSQYRAAWQKCRDLGKQLSKALAETGDNEFAFISPSTAEHPVCFGQIQSDTQMPLEYPLDQVERLASRLSFALDDWGNYTGWKGIAHVYPASSGRGVWFENALARSGDENTMQALGRLRLITDEAARLLQSYPELEIDRIVVNEHGIHTKLRVPGLEKAAEIDPLLGAIQAYFAGVKAMSDLPSGSVTAENEDALIEQTYGAPQRALLEWDRPAITKEAAIAALKFIGDERMIVDSLGEPLRLAVVRFLETL